MCTKRPRWSWLASHKGKAAHCLHALSARRMRQQTTLSKMLTSEAEFLSSERGPASSKRMVMIGAEEVGEEVMFTV